MSKNKLLYSDFKEISCKDDPFNVSSIAGQVLNRILEIKHEDPQAKIVIWSGEIHTMPMHRLLVASIIEKCKFWGINIALAEEQPHDSLLEILDIGGYDYTSRDFNEVAEIKRMDPDGRILLQACMSLFKSKWIPKTVRSLQLAILDNKIPFYFTDSSRGNNLWINKEDPLVQIAMNDMEFDPCPCPLSSSSMRARNAVMIHNSMEALNRPDVDVVIQSTGLNHVLGSFRMGSKEEESLSGQFRKYAQNHDHFYDIKIFIKSRGYIPEVSNSVLEETTNLFVVSDLDKTQFTPLRDGEKEFLSRAIDASGLNYFMSADDISKEEQDYYEDEVLGQVLSLRM